MGGGARIGSERKAENSVYYYYYAAGSYDGIGGEGDIGVPQCDSAAYLRCRCGYDAGYHKPAAHFKPCDQGGV